MKGFQVKGSFKDVRMGDQPFAVEIAAEDVDAAKEQIVSTLGSRHKVKRWQITIDSITEVAPDDIQDHIVKYRVGA